MGDTLNMINHWEQKHREQFCARLKRARTEAKLKQAQVARYLQLPVSAVSAFESGQRKVDAVELFMLSKFYQKPLEWFFEEGRPSSSLALSAGVSKNGTHYAQAPPGLNSSFEDCEDPLMLECFRMLQKAPLELRRSAAYGVIGFLSQR